MKKIRSSEKKMNWQDVTIEQLSSHWGNMGDAIGFKLAKYQNAYAYGDIKGEGIDVRCQYADEVVKVFKENPKTKDIYEKLLQFGWRKKRGYCDGVYFLEMQKENDTVWFDICDDNEVGYMTMHITPEYEKKCSQNIEDYYESDGVEMDILGEKVCVTEENIKNIFRLVCAHYIDFAEYAGLGMYNVMVDYNVFQVYPYDNNRDVYVQEYDLEGERADYSLGEYNFETQLRFLQKYYKTLRDKKEKSMDELADKTKSKPNVEQPQIDKSVYEKAFISYFESKGAVCHRNEYIGANNTSKEIIYCDKFGLVYNYFDNGDSNFPTIRIIKYPLPSKLYDEGIIDYLIEECLDSGMTNEIKEIANFLNLSNEDKDKIGVPHEYFYGWVWENGKWDDKANYENPNLTNFQQDSLKKHDDKPHKDSLLSKCKEYAADLIKTYVGEEGGNSISELEKLMYNFVANQDCDVSFTKSH